MPEAITVGATTSNDSRASYSNYGNCIDIFAPGSSVRSASFGSNTGSTLMSGTSMAAPHVAGVAALFLQHNSSATPAQVAEAIYSNATQGVVNNANSAKNNLLYSLFTGDNSDNGDDSGDEGDNGDEGDSGDDDSPSQPGNNNPVITSIQFSDNSGGPWNRTNVNWSVSDSDGDLATVRLELRNGSSTVDSQNVNVSGSSASGTNELRTRGSSDSIRVIVTDQAGNTDTVTMSLSGPNTYENGDDGNDNGNDPDPGDGEEPGDDEEQEAPTTNNPPVLENVDVNITTSGPWTRAHVSWVASDEDGDLATIMIDAVNGSIVDTQTITISGSNASGTTELRNRGNITSIRITVTDSKGNTSIQGVRL